MGRETHDLLDAECELTKKFNYFCFSMLCMLGKRVSKIIVTKKLLFTIL